MQVPGYSVDVAVTSENRLDAARLRADFPIFEQTFHGRPLAYLDSETAPFVVGRAHGAGRILLVTALDAWRWRSESGVAFDAGWRALVQRLAVDVPPPVAVTACRP